MNVVFVQYGDYGDVYRRLAAGGPETYRDQRRSVDFVASLAPAHKVTTVAVCDRPHDETVAPNLSSIGVTVEEAYSQSLPPLLERLSPDILICRTPHRGTLEWCAKRQLPVLPVFADIFSSRSLRERFSNALLSRVLRRCKAPAVCNHSLTASKSLAKVGIASERIVPWDFARIAPTEPAKNLRERGALSLFYAGIVSDAKGVGDLVRAVSIARRRGVSASLTFAGPGDADKNMATAEAEGVARWVSYLGVIPASSVLERMREHDAVVVPSRYAYAEGLPNTIFEALASRSPLIASDHPAFVQRLNPGVDSLRFRASDADSLAGQIASLASDPPLYAQLSAASADALAGLYCGVEWTELIAAFIDDPTNQSNWVRPLSLSERDL